MRDLFTETVYKILHEPLYQRSLWEISFTGAICSYLHKTSIRDLYTRRPDISGPPGKNSMKDLFNRNLFTRPLSKIPTQDLYTRPPSLPSGKTSVRDLFKRNPLQTLKEISIQNLLISLNLLARPLWKISLQELVKVSSQDLYQTRPLMRGLFTRSPDSSGPPGKTFMRDLFTRAPTRSLHKMSMRDPYTRSPDIPGPPGSLHRGSLQDLFTSPIWDISKQDLLISLDLLGLFTGALYKVSSQDFCERSLRKISWQGPHMRHLYTRALYKVSSQDPIWAGTTSMRVLFTIAP